MEDEVFINNERISVTVGSELETMNLLSDVKSNGCRVIEETGNLKIEVIVLTAFLAVCQRHRHRSAPVGTGTGGTGGSKHH